MYSFLFQKNYLEKSCTFLNKNILAKTIFKKNYSLIYLIMICVFICSLIKKKPIVMELNFLGTESKQQRQCVELSILYLSIIKFPVHCKLYLGLYFLNPTCFVIFSHNLILIKLFISDWHFSDSVFAISKATECNVSGNC